MKRLVTTCGLVASLLLTSCSKPEPKTVYLALETQTEKQRELNQDITHELARKMHSGDFVIVDQLVGGSEE
jgi:uncharacterized lipoprotein YmbA